MENLAVKTDECLAILLWNTCSARCAHCGVESSPDDRTAVPHERVLELIREAGRIYSPGWCFSVSGGEVFLHYDRLCQYVAEAKRNGGYSTLITNCFWATTPERAEGMLQPLAATDLRKLGVSADSFHSPYIPPQFVTNALKAARKYGIVPHLRSVATRSSRLWHVLRQLEDAELWFTEFMEMPVIPDGRARATLAEDLFVQDTLPLGKCPSASLTINASGKAMVCCNGGGSYPQLQIGDVTSHSLAQAELLFASDPTLNYLRNVGPAGCMQFLTDEDRASIEAKKYVNQCHLCIELFSQAQRGERLRLSIEERFTASVKREFAGILETAPV